MADNIDATFSDAPPGSADLTFLHRARELRGPRRRTGLAEALRRRLQEIEVCRAERIPWAVIASALAEFENLTPPPSASRLTAAYAQLPEVRARRETTSSVSTRPHDFARPERVAPMEASKPAGYPQPAAAATSPLAVSVHRPPLAPSPSSQAPLHREAVETELREKRCRDVFAKFSLSDPSFPAPASGA